MQHWIGILVVILFFNSSAFAYKVGGGTNNVKDPYASTRNKQVQTQPNEKDFWNRPDFEAAVVACISDAATASGIQAFGVIIRDTKDLNTTYSHFGSDFQGKEEIEYIDRTINPRRLYSFKKFSNKIYKVDVVSGVTKYETAKPLQNEADKKAVYETIIKMMRSHFTGLN